MMNVENMRCPYCNGTNTKKHGKLESGKQRYYCKDCKRGFSSATIIREKLNMECPKCKNTHIVRGGFLHGQQRYQCRGCGHRFTLNPVRKISNKIEITCPKCNNKYVVKSGFTKDKRQYYRCTECNHKFTEQPKHRYLSTEDTKKIIILHNTGVPNIDIANKLKVDVKTIYNKLRPVKLEEEKENKRVLREIQRAEIEKQKLLESKKKVVIEKKKEEPKMQLEQVNPIIIKEILSGTKPDTICSKFKVTKTHLNNIMRTPYRQETLTESQKKLIYKFGVLLNTDPEYVAPYVPCSIKICEEYISKFKKNNISKYERTERDMYFDRLELDKFIS